MNEIEGKNSRNSKKTMRIRDPRWSQYGPTGFLGYLDQLARRLEINVETFLVGAISLLLISIALLLDQLPLFLMAILLTPILSPILGMAFGFALGSFKFIKIGLLSLFLNFISFFVVGAFSGFIARQFPERKFIIWKFFLDFNWTGVLLLMIGILIMISTIIKNPRQASLVANIALAYSFYLPLVAAAFAFGQGDHTSFIQGLFTFFQYYGVSIILCVLILLLYKIHPIRIKNWWGLGILVLLSAAIIFFQFKPDIYRNLTKIDKNVPEVVKPEIIASEAISAIIPTATMVVPSVTNTVEKPSQIITEIATSTVTITLTPLPSIIWAEIRSPVGDGANIRVEPGYSSKILRTVLNGTAVQILDEVEVIDGATWVHIRLLDQQEGWIVRTLIVSATPEPEW